VSPGGENVWKVDLVVRSWWLLVTILLQDVQLSILVFAGTSVVLNTRQKVLEGLNRCLSVRMSCLESWSQIEIVDIPLWMSREGELFENWNNRCSCSELVKETIWLDQGESSFLLLLSLASASAIAFPGSLLLVVKFRQKMQSLEEESTVNVCKGFSVDMNLYPIEKVVSSTVWQQA
jgi:hypothetical protein